VAGAIIGISISYAYFGRTRRIRTADLYHVKADWPHQDTRGHPETYFSSGVNFKLQALLMPLGRQRPTRAGLRADEVDTAACGCQLEDSCHSKSIALATC
jgi:hypothetical protein